MNGHLSLTLLAGRDGKLVKIQLVTLSQSLSITRAII